MLYKGDKITMRKPIGNFDHVGELLEVTEVRDNGDFCYMTENGKVEGIASQEMFDKYFEMYDKPKKPEVSDVDTGFMWRAVTSDVIDAIIEDSEISIATAFDKCTIVACRLPNGFVIVESAACVDPDNYDEEIGVEACMERIYDKVWELEGYRTQDKIAEQSGGFDDGDDGDDEFACCGDCKDCDLYVDHEDVMDDDDYWETLAKSYEDYLDYLDDMADDYARRYDMLHGHRPIR